MNQDLSIKRSSFLIVEQSIRDSGRKIIDMVMVFRYGLMVLSMKVTGKIIKLMEEDNSGILMVMSLMENGKKIKHMDMESILMLTEQNMKESGKMIYNMVEV